MNSKAKGSAGERELCMWLTAHGYPARRNEQRYIGGKGKPTRTDVFLPLSTGGTARHG